MPRKARGRPDRRQKRSRFRYFSDILVELKKVVWPTRQEAIRLTMMVIAVSVAVGLALGILDYGFTQLTKLIFPG